MSISHSGFRGKKEKSEQRASLTKIQKRRRKGGQKAGDQAGKKRCLLNATMGVRMGGTGWNVYNQGRQEEKRKKKGQQRGQLLQ